MRPIKVQNHDEEHALTDWYLYSAWEEYRHCTISFCPYYELRDRKF